MGFAAGDSATFAATGDGQQAAMRGMSQAMSKKRRMLAEAAAPMPASESFFDEEDRAVVEQRAVK
jgi:hypothetical protein